MQDENTPTSTQQTDYTLRPEYLHEFIGQDKVKEQLEIAIGAAKLRGEVLGHVLLVGPPGLGKTTLAKIIANEMGAQFNSTIGPNLERLNMASHLTNLAFKDVLFIDEIHRTRNEVQEYLYPAMEDYKLELTIGQGPSASMVSVPLQRFTLIGATTREGLLTGPFRDRFGHRVRIDYYTPEELRIIIHQNAKQLNIQIDEESEWELANRSRGTPRIAKRLLQRVWDFATFKATGVIDLDIVRIALEFFGVDQLGLDRRDRLYLQTLIQTFSGRAGLRALSVALSEDERTLEDVYEPFLVQIGFITLTKQGRVAMKPAYDHLELTYDEDTQRKLF